MDKSKDQLILEAAFQVFSAKGFHRAKMEEIAEQAGVGKGTIYEYFKSKAHLFHEMVQGQMDKYFVKLEEGLYEEARAIDKMYNIIKNHIIFIKDFQGIANKYFSEAIPEKEHKIDFKAKMIATYREKLEMIKEIIRQGINNGEFRKVDVDMLAMFFFGSLGGITNAMLMLNIDQDPDHVAKEMIDFIVNGIKK